MKVRIVKNQPLDGQDEGSISHLIGKVMTVKRYDSYDDTVSIDQNEHTDGYEEIFVINKDEYEKLDTDFNLSVMYKDGTSSSIQNSKCFSEKDAIRKVLDDSFSGDIQVASITVHLENPRN